MNVKDDRKQDRRPYLLEIGPGTLFKRGDSYFIKTHHSVYREQRINIVSMSCCVDEAPKCEFDNWYEPVNAISVLTGKPYSFSPSELVEVFPDAFISVRGE